MTASPGNDIGSDRADAAPPALVATYRVQLNPSLGFRAAAELVPYLAKLGVSHLYVSPIFAARAGTSGYHVLDPNRLDPELGSPEDFEALVRSLQARGMGLLLDIVPNHLAADAANPWWMDVLEQGRRSRHARFFDIAWGAGDREVVILPLLGEPPDDSLAKGLIHLTIEEIQPQGAQEQAEGADGFPGANFFLRYFDQRFPLNLDTWPDILAGDGPVLPPGVRHLVGALRSVSPSEAKRRLGKLWSHSDGGARTYLEGRLSQTNAGEEGAPSLAAILAKQHYRLADYREARERTAYRRFFDINSLVGLRVEDPEVFEESHRLVFDLIRRGAVAGLRVDHVDGLRDPEGYLRRLRSGAPRTYVVVEKILSHAEVLRPSWPVAGTTGYDFLADVSRLFLDPDGFALLDKLYVEWVGSIEPFSEIVHASKRRVLQIMFRGELRALGAKLAGLASGERPPAGVEPAHSRDDLERALAELSCALPVYRTYIRSAVVEAEDRRLITHAAAQAGTRTGVTPGALELVRRILVLDPTCPAVAADPSAALDFVLSWQQLTGPLAAKGVEDTAFYRYNRLLSLDEVGADPAARATSVNQFHARNRRILATWPHTLNATSTHDTKRSEDVRARIDALSELAEDWEAKIRVWSDRNSRFKRVINGAPVPAPREELLIYQSLAGAWPLAEDEVNGFRARFGRFLVKAAREAKTQTSWVEPDQAYEAALTDFAGAILGEDNQEFIADLREFVPRVARLGALTSLSQALLKIASPGVPDLYQGNELWDLSLVDPDNRRPVDFPLRRRLLDELAAPAPAQVQALLESWSDGRLKLFVTHRALHCRGSHPDLFLAGDYLPALASGLHGDRVVAFARRLGPDWALLVVSRLLNVLPAKGPAPLGEVWGDTRLELPEGAPALWHDVLTDRRSSTQLGFLPMAEVFSQLPFALFENRDCGAHRTPTARHHSSAPGCDGESSGRRCHDGCRRSLRWSSSR